MDIEQIVKQRQYVQGQIEDLKEELAALNGEIITALEGSVGAQDIGGYKVSVSTKRTFKSDVAAQLLERKRLTKKELAALQKPAQLDGAKVKVLYPDVYDKAAVESAPYVTIKG